MTPDVRNDFTYPSGFNRWTMNVLGYRDCTLVVDDSLDYKPMATLRLMMRQVFLKKDPSDDGKCDFYSLVCRVSVEIYLKPVKN